MCAIAADDREVALSVEVEPPSAFVSEVVVFVAEREQICDVGRPTVAEVFEVVNDDIVPGDAAARDGAPSVHGS